MTKKLITVINNNGRILHSQICKGSDSIRGARRIAQLREGALLLAETSLDTNKTVITKLLEFDENAKDVHPSIRSILKENKPVTYSSIL